MILAKRFQDVHTRHEALQIAVIAGVVQNVGLTLAPEVGYDDGKGDSHSARQRDARLTVPPNDPASEVIYR